MLCHGYQSIMTMTSNLAIITERVPVIFFIKFSIRIRWCNGHIGLKLRRLEQRRHDKPHVWEKILPKALAKPRPCLKAWHPSANLRFVRIFTRRQNKYISKLMPKAGRKTILVACNLQLDHQHPVEIVWAT